MKRIVDRKVLLCLVAALTVFATAPTANTQENSSLDKHSRKVEKKLSKFRQGSYVQIDFRDSSESFGSLGALSGTTFQLTNADNNQTETFSYSSVADVRKGKAYIGEGSEPGHHPHLLLPVVIGAAAAAAAVAVVETVR
jgi:hypothetical protein